MLSMVLRGVVAPVLRLVYRPVVEGREHVPRRGPVILASNHLSFVDSVAIPLVAPRRVVFLAKAEYFVRPGLRGVLLRMWMQALGAVPIERGTHRGAQAALETALGVLREGQAFGIYPEGTRSRDGRLYRGRTGVASLALTAGVPVVPVGVIGTDTMQPIGARFPRVHRVTVRFGAPIHVQGRNGRPAQLRRAVTDEVMDAIHALTGQERAAGYNDPPGTGPGPLE